MAAIFANFFPAAGMTNKAPNAAFLRSETLNFYYMLINNIDKTNDCGNK
jgi:hypothetical protein